MSYRRAVCIVSCLVALVASCLHAQNPITNGSFETLGADGLAPDWQFMGDVTVQPTKGADGKHALRLRRSENAAGETGLNRGWTFNSAQQGNMLAQRKGAIRFRYKAVSQDGPGAQAIYIIPMTNRAGEFGGHRTRWSIPDRHVGDGQWHTAEFAYDYTETPKVEWVHVSARLLKAGELWLDAFEWLLEVDAVPTISHIVFFETAGREGREGTVEAELKNLGSKPMVVGSASIRLPVGLSCASAIIETPELGAGEQAILRWIVRGPRGQAQYDIPISVRVGERETECTLQLERAVELLNLQCGQMTVPPGKRIRVELIAQNTGHTIVDSVPCRLEAPTGVLVEKVRLRADLLPGLEAPVAAWHVTAPDPSPLVRLKAIPEGPGNPVETDFLVADLASPPRSPRKACYALASKGWLLIGSQKTRLAVFDGAEGVRGAFLQVKRRWRWQTVAIMPRLGLVRAVGGDAPLRLPEVSIEEARSATLTLRGTTKSSGGVWTATCVLRAAPDSDQISYELTTTATDGTPALLTLEGPMLYSVGSLPARDDAILPGLEWLVKGESSSNSLDIKPDHPDRLRYIPHPLKVTIPAVGMRFGDVVLGLLWDAPPAQPSYAIAGSASLVFASPDRFGGHGNSLMGLMLPGVDRGLPENTRTTTKSLAAAPGEPLELTLRANLLATCGASSALVALDRWFTLHGVPEPLPYPRGSATDEIAFSLKAYAKDKELWNAERNMWYSDIIVGFRPITSPAWELLMGAKLMGDGVASAQARDLALSVLKLSVPEAEKTLHYHADPDVIRGLVRQGQVTAATQGDDGNWGFTGKKAAEEWPDEGVDYSKLGAKGAREVGLSAAKAIVVLNAALLSNDPVLRKAGIKALKGMDRFRIPRAAQVWEVPVHTPDILASAKAVDAYLAGYRLTGDKKYLDEAVYWARTGLPFVYMWGPRDNPMIQGATIPVFGATSYGLSWFAVAVQWNGLCYSQALYDLAEHDQSFPWKRVADNILVSGMYQQAIAGGRLAQWPDAVNFIKGRKGAHGQTPPCFRPTTIINQTLLNMGIRRTPRNIPLRKGGQTLVLRTTALVQEAAWSGTSVRIRAAFTPPVHGSICLFSVEKPGRILLDGEQLPAASTSSSGSSAWTWHEREGLVDIALIHSGAADLVVEGIIPKAGDWIPTPVRAIDFNFADGIEGWAGANQVMALENRDGALETTTTGEDPYIIHGNLQVAGKEGDVLEVDIALPPGATPLATSVYWSHAHQGGFSPSRTLSVKVPREDTFERVRIPVGEHDEWQNQVITDLRIDPINGEAGTKVRIRSIRLIRAE